MHVGQRCNVYFEYETPVARFSLIELLVAMGDHRDHFALSVPIMSRARLNTAETMVVREMPTIAQCQTQYFSQFGKYAVTLAQLGPPSDGGAEGPQAAR